MEKSIRLSLFFIYIFSCSLHVNVFASGRSGGELTERIESSCYAPDWLSTINITHTTATWDWNAMSGALSYSVQWRFAGGVWYDLPGGPWTGTLLNIGGLQPATSYEWRVRSNCAGGMVSPWSYSAAFTTLGSSCSTPAGLATTNITETTANFSWAPVSGAINYSVQRRLPGGTWSFVPGSPFNSTSITVTGFNPATTYEWRVRTNCAYGDQSLWSNPVSFTTMGSFSCSPPDWLNTINVTQTTATLDWSAASGAVSYSVQWRFEGTGTWYNLPGGPWSGTLLNLGGLQPGTSYEWRVRSNCYNGMTSQWSMIAGFTTLGASCHTPSGLHVTNITESSATLHWSPVSGAGSYSVQIRLPNGMWTFVNGSPFNDTWVTVNWLSPGTIYEFRVRANCGYNNHSNWSAPGYFTTAGSFACHAPDWLGTFNITQSTATWDWSPVSGAISYSVQWRYPGGTWYNLPGGPWSGTLLNIGGLQPGTTYEWRVRSNCANGMVSEWSVPATFTTLSSSCSTPTGLSTSNVTETSATFNWSPVSGAVSYSVQIRWPNGLWSNVTGSPFTNTSVTINGLTPGATYEWRVRANCGYSHTSPWSYPLSFTTVGSFTCDPPAGLSTYNITHTTATWDWTPVIGAVSYSVQWRFPGGNWNNLPGGPWTGTSLNIGGLQPGTAYEWRVRSNCAYGVISEWSAPAAFTTLSSTCEIPSGLHTTNVTSQSATLHWSPVAGAHSYSVQIRLPNGTWTYVSGSPFNDTWVTVNWLNPGTTYEWRVKAHCGYSISSNWSSPAFFTTQGSMANDNDHCSNATVLPVNTSCMYTSASNINATASSPPPVGYCSSYGYKDVWFTFTMPNVSYPKVTIRTAAGTLTDAVMEVYYGYTCSNMSFLGCEDDNNNGNGSAMPVMSLAGGAGATIWVRVWGHGGSTGTFNICVFNYISNNYTGSGQAPEIISNDDEPGFTLGKAEESIMTQIPESDLVVAPNPANEFLRIEYAQHAQSLVTGIVFHDMAGKILERRSYDSRNTGRFDERVDVSGFTPGIYTLQVMTTSGILTRKISIVD